LVEKTKFPVPVSSVTRVASLSDVSIDDDDTLLLKSDQSDEVRQPKVDEFAVLQETVLTERVSPDEKDKTFS